MIFSQKHVLRRSLLLSAFIALILVDRSHGQANASGGSTTSPLPSPKQIDASLSRGVAFLLDAQNKDGTWGSHRNTKGLNIFAPAPGSPRAFRLATTALCISALIEIGGDDVKAVAAERRAGDRLLEDLPKLRRAGPVAIYNTWAHGYGIQALVRMHAREKDSQRRARILKTVAHQVGMLNRYEFVNGGWGYYNFGGVTQRPSGSPTSFTTSTILIALYEARQLGVEVPEKMVQRALASVKSQRAPDFSYAYSDRSRLRPGSAINRPAGGLGRAQVCNLACRIWGDEKVTVDVFRNWLDRLFSRNYWLDIGRKRPVPHESWAQVAGYFYYYGHYYAAQCIEQLPKDEHAMYQQKMAALMLSLQEKDGSWWDYPLYNYHQPYGTAFALMTLGKCRQLKTNLRDGQ